MISFVHKLHHRRLPVVFPNSHDITLARPKFTMVFCQTLFVVRQVLSCFCHLFVGQFGDFLLLLFAPKRDNGPLVSLRQAFLPLWNIISLFFPSRLVLRRHGDICSHKWPTLKHSRFFEGLKLHRQLAVVGNLKAFVIEMNGIANDSVLNSKLLQTGNRVEFAL